MENALKVNKWTIVFVQDCNLRCSYCSTGYGRFGDRNPKELLPSLWKKVIDFILNHTDTKKKVFIDFQGGETFTRFEPFIEFLKIIKSNFKKSNIDLEIDVATNGVLLNAKRLRICQEMGINLSFSIDGCENQHDLHRRDINGQGTFKKTFRNWQEYKKLSEQHGNVPSCSFKSVATTENRLSDILSFWNTQGVDIVDIILEERSLHVENGDQEKLESRRKTYLNDLEIIAKDCVARSTGTFFFNNFKGPEILLSLWEMMLKNRFAGSCAAGKDVLGIDPFGNLFPCHVFTGQTQWNIGTVYNGIDNKALEHFLIEKERAYRVCSDCTARQFCGGGCLFNGNEKNLKHNSPGGCEFIMEVINIADRSFKNMCK